MLVEELIKECIAKDFGIDPTKLVPTFNFEREGFDSLDLVEALMAIEVEFDIEIPDDTLAIFSTYGELETYLLGQV